jgi:hypothetical protein
MITEEEIEDAAKDYSMDWKESAIFGIGARWAVEKMKPEIDALQVAFNSTQELSESRRNTLVAVKNEYRALESDYNALSQDNVRLLNLLDECARQLTPLQKKDHNSLTEMILNKVNAELNRR